MLTADVRGQNCLPLLLSEAPVVPAAVLLLMCMAHCRPLTSAPHSSLPAAAAVVPAAAALAAVAAAVFQALVSNDQGRAQLLLVAVSAVQSSWGFLVENAPGSNL